MKCFSEKMEKRFLQELPKIIIPAFSVFAITMISFVFSESDNTKREVSVLKEQVKELSLINQECQDKIIMLNQDVEKIFDESDNNNTNNNQYSKELKKVDERLNNLEKRLNENKQQTNDGEQQTLNYSTLLENIKNNNSDNNAITICLISGVCVILAYILQPFSKKLADKCFPDKTETKNDNDSD